LTGSNDVKYEMLLCGFVFCIFILIFGMPLASAQSLPITISDAMENVIFDGKWTNYLEWKQSSLERLYQESNVTSSYIRTAHLDNFIYILLDVVADKTIDNNQDEAAVCFDAKTDQNILPDQNDYCFVINLGSDKPVTLQGTSNSEGFKVIENHVDLIAVGQSSDENDRYSKIPHASYEFRIPIELLERTDHYGFYVQVFDFTDSKIYTWPPGINLESNSEIPSPSKWGLIYSPDKSLPEYDLPMLVLVIGILSSIFVFYRVRKITFIYSN